MKDPSCSHNCIMFTSVVLLCIDVLYCANKGVLNGSVILCYNYDVKSVRAESVRLRCQESEQPRAIIDT